MARDEKKQIIIDAALSLFLESGAEKTKIVAIARRAGIGKSTFYEYFQNKADLICQWMESVMAKFSLSPDVLTTLPDNATRIRTLLRASFDPSLGTPEMMVMFVEFWRLAFNEKHPQAMDILEQMYREYSATVQGLLEDGIAQGEFADCDCPKVASALIAGIDGLWLQSLTFGREFDLPGHGEVFIDTMLAGINREEK